MNHTLSSAARSTLIRSWWMLKLTYGLLFVVAGADKFLNLVTQWEKYISPYILNFIPISSTNFIYGVGIVEIIIGVVTLLVMTRLGAYLTAFWFGLIVINLLSMRMYFDIAVRDIVMAIGAIVLAQLSDVKDELTERH